MQIICKTCAIRFLMSEAFQKLKMIKIWPKVGQDIDLFCYMKK